MSPTSYQLLYPAVCGENLRPCSGAVKLGFRLRFAGAEATRRGPSACQPGNLWLRRSPGCSSGGCYGALSTGAHDRRRHGGWPLAVGLLREGRATPRPFRGRGTTIRVRHRPTVSAARSVGAERTSPWCGSGFPVLDGHPAGGARPDGSGLRGWRGGSYGSERSERKRGPSLDPPECES